MKTVEAKIPVSQVPIIKQAARELDIDMIVESGGEGELVSCHFLIADYGSLISIGFIAATNSFYKQLTGPLAEVIDTLQKKVDDVKNKTDQS